MISNKKFSNFNPQIFVVGCFIEYDGKILLLKRANDKYYNDKWSCPGGKKEKNETNVETAVREVFEETGIKIIPEKIEFIEHTYVRFDKFDFTYTFYKYVLDNSKNIPKVILHTGEHSDYMWITPKDALKEDLIEDEDYCIKVAYNIR